MDGWTSQTGTAVELRIDDLARAAGTTVRNVRAYQNRGLLPPPRRDGRVGWYGPAHLARLRLIGSLVERGFTLASIGELVERWSHGEELGDLLGLAGPYTDEVADVGTWDEITERYGLSEQDREAFDQSLRFRLIEVDGDRVTVTSPRLFRAGLALHRAGVPYEDLFAELRWLESDINGIAERFVRLVVRNVIEPRLKDGVPRPADAPELVEIVRRLRPLANTVVSSQLARSLAARTEAELGEHAARILTELHAPETTTRTAP